MILGFLFTDDGSPPSPSMVGTDLAMIECSKLTQNSLRREIKHRNTKCCLNSVLKSTFDVNISIHSLILRNCLRMQQMK